MELPSGSGDAPLLVPANEERLCARPPMWAEERIQVDLRPVQGSMRRVCGMHPPPSKGDAPAQQRLPGPP